MHPLVLLTRPRAQAQDFAARLQQETASASPYEIRIEPLSDIAATPFDTAAFDAADGLILTSTNAVARIASLAALRGKPAWCVGPVTTKHALAAGLHARDGGGDANTLLAHMLDARPPGLWIHAHGAKLARDISGDLTKAGLQAKGIQVYAAHPCEWSVTTRDELMSIHNTRVLAPLFSPAAATYLANQFPQGLIPDHFEPLAISQNCVQALPQAARACTKIAKRPNSDAVLDLILEALSHHSPCGLRPTRAEATKT